MNGPEINKLTNFLLRHKEFAVNLISEYYPFNEKELHKYADKLIWCYIATNEAIIWSEELYIEFSDKISVSTLTRNKKFPWTEDFIAKNYIALFQLNEDDEFPGMFFSMNPSLPFSRQFIETYKEIWHWGFLSSNPGIPFTIELIDEFKDYWVYEEFEYNDKIISDPVLKFHTGVNSSPNSFEKRHSCIYCDTDMYYVFEKNLIDLYKIFHCPNFKWDFYLLKLIKENADKKKEFKDPLIYLEESTTVPWSIELLELFENHWNYYMLPMNEYVGKYITKTLENSMAVDELISQLMKND